MSVFDNLRLNRAVKKSIAETKKERLKILKKRNGKNNLERILMIASKKLSGK